MDEDTNGFFGNLVDRAAEAGNRKAALWAGILNTDGFRRQKAEQADAREYRRRLREITLESAELDLTSKRRANSDYEANAENRELMRQNKNLLLKNSLFQNSNVYYDNIIRQEEQASKKVLADMQANDPGWANLDDLSKSEFQKRNGKVQEEYILLNRLYLKGQKDPDTLKAFDRYVNQSGWERINRDGQEYLRNMSTGQEEPLTLENGQEKLRQLNEDYKKSMAAYAKLQGPRDNVFKTLAADSLRRIGQYTTTLGQAQDILQNVMQGMSQEDRNTAVFLHNLKQMQKGDYFNQEELTAIYPQMLQLAQRKGLRIHPDANNPLASSVELPDGTRMGIMDWAAKQKEPLAEKIAAIEEAGKQRQQAAAREKLKADVMAAREDLGGENPEENWKVKTGRAIAKQYGFDLNALFKSRNKDSKIKDENDVAILIADAFARGQEAMLEEKDPAQTIAAFRKGFTDELQNDGIPANRIPEIGVDADMDLREQDAKEQYRKANKAREQFRAGVRSGQKKPNYVAVPKGGMVRNQDGKEEDRINADYARAEKKYSGVIEEKRQRREQKKQRKAAQEAARTRMKEFYERTLKR